MEPKTKTILFILLSFILGIFVGWILENQLSSKIQHSSGRGSHDFQKVLAERLHLSEQQIFQVDSLLDTRKQRMEEYRKQALAIRDTVRMEIRKLLKADQGKLFDEFIQEMNVKETNKKEREAEKK